MCALSAGTVDFLNRSLVLALTQQTQTNKSKVFYSENIYLKDLDLFFDFLRIVQEKFITDFIHRIDLYTEVVPFN